MSDWQDIVINIVLISGFSSLQIFWSHIRIFKIHVTVKNFKLLSVYY